MATSVTMPQLGESVTEGTVTRWLKRVGDTVSADEPLLEVSTDKVDTEIPAGVRVLTEIRANEDDAWSRWAGNSPSSPMRPRVRRRRRRALLQPPLVLPQPTCRRRSPPGCRRTPPAPRPAALPPVPARGVNVELPALGESVTEGTVTRWLKQVGDTVVGADEPLLEVSTDKVDTEIPFAPGVLTEIRVNEDETTSTWAPVLAVIGSPGATPVRRGSRQPGTRLVLSRLRCRHPALPHHAAAPAPLPWPHGVPSAARPGDAVYVNSSCASWRKGVDLSTVTGTGGWAAGSANRDVRVAAAATQAAQAPAAVPAPAAPAPPAPAARTDLAHLGGARNP